MHLSKPNASRNQYISLEVPINSQSVRYPETLQDERSVRCKGFDRDQNLFWQVKTLKKSPETAQLFTDSQFTLAVNLGGKIFWKSKYGAMLTLTPQQYLPQILKTNPSSLKVPAVPASSFWGSHNPSRFPIARGLPDSKTPPTWWFLLVYHSDFRCYCNVVTQITVLRETEMSWTIFACYRCHIILGW